jgi:hypothetical protein
MGETEGCPRCGSSADFLECWECGGDGWIEVEDDDFCSGETHIELCQGCNGKCGSWHCPPPPEWCEAHPMKGCENIESTAIDARVWADRR